MYDGNALRPNWSGREGRTGLDSFSLFTFPLLEGMESGAELDITFVEGFLRTTAFFDNIFACLFSTLK